jgi:dTDP-4-dehydrorhamnose reductase
MIVLLGGSGYVGSAFRRELKGRKAEFISLSRLQVNYYDETALTKALEGIGPAFLINAAGYTGKPNVDSCETDKHNCLLGNAVLPGIIRVVCNRLGIPWGHVSSGCIYTGSKADGSGFTELDPPNFSFRTNNCSFYSGTKALGEECLSNRSSTYIWRLRIPFSNEDSPRNYISKLLRYDTLLDATNSISNLTEFVVACLQCWELRLPFGIYNVTNTGNVTTRQVVEWIRQYLNVSRYFQFFESENKFYQIAARTPRSNCVLDNSKLLRAGVCMTTIDQSLQDALKNWRTDSEIERN